MTPHPTRDDILLHGAAALTVATPDHDDPRQLVGLARELGHALVDAELLGLAANQLGRPERLFVYVDLDQDRPPLAAAANPHVVTTSDAQQTDLEGCGSFPGLYVAVTRPQVAEFTYATLDGQTHERRCEGLMARLWLHETDHLDGITMLDHLAAHDVAGAEAHWKAILEECGGDAHRAARLGPARPYRRAAAAS